MPASTVIKHLYDGVIALIDNTPVTLTVAFSVGDLTIKGLAQTLREVIAYESRGTLASVRHTKRTFPTGSFSYMLADYSDSTNNTVIDFIRKLASYSGNTSTLGTTSDVYTIDIRLTVEGTNFGDGSDHVILLEDCHCTIDLDEGEPNKGTISFTCYGAVTIT